MEKLQRYFDAIEAELSKIEYAAEPDGLYAPCVMSCRWAVSA